MRRNPYEQTRRAIKRIARAAATPAAERSAATPSVGYIVQAGGIPAGGTEWVKYGQFDWTPFSDFRFSG